MRSCARAPASRQASVAPSTLVIECSPRGPIPRARARTFFRGSAPDEADDGAAPGDGQSRGGGQRLICRCSQNMMVLARK